MRALASVTLAIHLLAGCAAARSEVALRPPEVAHRQLEVASGLAALDQVATQWPFWRPRELPLLFVQGDGALLVDSAPRAGFRPLEGKHCPCWKQGRSVPLLAPEGRVWILAQDGGSRPWSWSDRVRAIGSDELVALVVVGLTPRISMATVAHELFHQYEAEVGLLDRLHERYRPVLRRKPRTRASAERLLLEQAHLAELLREPPEIRGKGLSRWVAERQQLESDDILAKENDDHELVEGLPTCVELEVSGRAFLGRREAELRLARRLDQGGRGLSADLWYLKHRPYETGAAICLLLSDGWPGWQGTRWSDDSLFVRLAHKVEVATPMVPTKTEVDVRNPPRISELPCSLADDMLAEQASGVLRLAVTADGIEIFPDSHEELSPGTLYADGYAFVDQRGSRGYLRGVVRRSTRGDDLMLYLFGARAMGRLRVLDGMIAPGEGQLDAQDAQWAFWGHRPRATRHGNGLRLQLGKDIGRSSMEEAP